MKFKADKEVSGKISRYAFVFAYIYKRKINSGVKRVYVCFELDIKSIFDVTKCKCLLNEEMASYLC